jgi:hypothetical protein
VGRGDCHWPLCWELLDNRSGNSNAGDRAALLDFCLRVLGPDRVGLVVGDREFVGHAWFKYLKDQGIFFVMRLPKHHLLTDRAGADAMPWPTGAFTRASAANWSCARSTGSGAGRRSRPWSGAGTPG